MSDGSILVNWQTVGSIVGAVGGVLGGWSLLRTVWREQSKLIVAQKRDKGWHKIDRPWAGAPAMLTVTMLLSNRSSRPNAVLYYEAGIVQKDGTRKKIEVEQGNFSLSTHDDDTIDIRHFGVTPLNIPPFSTVEAVICFLEVRLEECRHPLLLEITTHDMYGKEFTGSAEIPV